MADTAIYVYCVLEADSIGGRARVPVGLAGGARPLCLPLGRRWWAVASEVPLSKYSPKQIETGLQNLAWVADIAVAHEAVVEHFAARRGATVVPMKLFTMFTSTARAVADLRAKRQVLSAALRRVRGCDEWGVRAVRAARAAVPAVRAAAPARSGADFLAAKKRERDEARAAVVGAAEAVESVFHLLAPLSRDSRRRTDYPESAATPPLLDAAFLVPAVRKARFRAAAKRAAAACRSAGVQLTLSGPWPAYNFVQPDPP